MIHCILATIFAILLVFVPLASPEKISTNIDIWEEATLIPLLTPSLTNSFRLELTPEFEVIDGHYVILLDRKGNLFDLTRREYISAKTPLQVTSFAFNAGLLVAIRNNRLGWYEADEIKELLDLPRAGMKVVSGAKSRLYLYGSHGQESLIYLLEDGKAILLLDIKGGKISALTVIGERLFFAIDNMIYTLSKGERAGLLFIVAGEKSIQSLVADPITGVLYFSAGETVYAMRAGVAIPIMRGLTGSLRYSEGALFILAPEQGRLVKILGLEKLTKEKIGLEPAMVPPAGQFKE